MKKKMYVTPLTEVVEMESTTLMAGSDARTIGYTNQEASNEHEALAGERRGGWGSLWE
jgi:hypothetical protein